MHAMMHMLHMGALSPAARLRGNFDPLHTNFDACMVGGASHVMCALLCAHVLCAHVCTGRQLNCMCGAIYAACI